MATKPLMLLGLSVGFCVFAAGDAVAETSLIRTGNPETWCRNGFFPSMSERYQVAEVITPKPLLVDYATGDKASPCPNDEPGKCLGSGPRLAKGSRLVISSDYGHFTCAFDPKTGSAGWIDRAAIRLIATPSIAAGDWIGTWGFFDNRITIKPATGGALKATGNAFWYGGLMPDGSRNTHVGEFDITASAKSDRLSNLPLEDSYDCAVELIHVGPYLVVRDNHNCGGANVSFDGVYRRQKGSKP